jgi:hypothetical protein
MRCLHTRGGGPVLDGVVLLCLGMNAIEEEEDGGDGNG